MQTWEGFVTWAFCGMIGAGLIYAGRILDEIKQTFKEVRDEIKDLNTKVAVVIEKTGQHEKLFEKHDERISKIEDKI